MDLSILKIDGKTDADFTVCLQNITAGYEWTEIWGGDGKLRVNKYCIQKQARFFINLKWRKWRFHKNEESYRNIMDSLVILIKIAY